MLRTLYKDPERYRETYWDRYGDIYFAGDGARRDEDGYYWITGRVDDVMNVSGHRISTAEVESALVGHQAVAEAAVIGRQDEDKGQAIVAYVILEGDREGSDDLIQELNQQVRKAIGPHAKPEEIIFTPELPKTRSGKIMRRILRGVAEGEDDLGRYLDPRRSFRRRRPQGGPPSRATPESGWRHRCGGGSTAPLGRTGPYWGSSRRMPGRIR